ncbi:DUF4351 domain-containing protein [Acaryochloris thomasi]|nr:DUF4351 domain-containing protein [Acaryochloris thomasi]
MYSELRSQIKELSLKQTEELGEALFSEQGDLWEWLERS